jgi:hypothetical protein
MQEVRVALKLPIIYELACACAWLAPDLTRATHAGDRSRVPRIVGSTVPSRQPDATEPLRAGVAATVHRVFEQLVPQPPGL